MMGSTGGYSTVNLLKKCEAALTSMASHFSDSAFSDAPVLDSTFRAEVEQLCRDMNAHAEQLERDGVEQRSVHHPTKAEGRAPRGATGSLKAKTTQGRKRLPTGDEVKGRRGGAVPLTEDEKRRAKAVQDAKDEKDKNPFF